MDSNHTLHALQSPDENDELDDIDSHGYEQDESFLGFDGANLLKASLKLNINSNKMMVARRKILWSHARGDLNIGESSIATGAMPRILAWFGNGLDETVQYHEPPLFDAKSEVSLSNIETRVDTARLDSIYRILRAVPQSNLLLNANTALASEHEIDNPQDEIAELREENERLLERLEVLQNAINNIRCEDIDMCGESKRRRV